MQKTIDGKCAHENTRICPSLVIGGCTVCLDCGEHLVKPLFHPPQGEEK